MLTNHHRRAHTNEEYTCDQCGKVYRYKFNFNKHLETHSGVISRPFVCEFCGVGFRRNMELKVFQRTNEPFLAFFVSFQLQSRSHATRRTIEAYTRAKSGSNACIVRLNLVQAHVTICICAKFMVCSSAFVIPNGFNWRMFLKIRSFFGFQVFRY